jgi:hypothetical protein
MKKKRIAAAVMAALVGSASPATSWASEREELEALRQTTVRLLQLMQERGLLPRSEVEKLLKEAGTPTGGPGPTGAAAATGAAAGAAAGAAGGTASRTVRVPYVPETVRNQMKEEIRQEVLAQAKEEGWANPSALPSWLSRFTFEGDIRLRYQGDFLDPNNAFYINEQQTNLTRSLQLLNTTEDRDRFRVRARLGAQMRVNEWTTAGIRIVTGQLTDPTSSNQTAGNYWNKYTISLDRAYVDVRPYTWLEVLGGRIGIPFFGTDLVWADDLSVDAAMVKLKPFISDTFEGGVVLGAFPLQELELSPNDKWMYGGQLQGLWKGQRDLRTRLGIGFYAYTNTTGELSPPGSTINEGTAPLFLQKGNTVFNISSDPTRPLLGLAAEYRLLNITGSVDLPAFNETRFTLIGDYVRNLAFDEAAVSANVGTTVDPRVTGWQVRAQLGSPHINMRNSWNFFVGYKYLERDATLDAFTDPTFHLGGTDGKGYIIGGNYGLGQNVWATLRYFSTDAIDGPPLKSDTLQVDLNARF